MSGHNGDSAVSAAPNLARRRVNAICEATSFLVQYGQATFGHQQSGSGSFFSAVTREEYGALQIRVNVEHRGGGMLAQRGPHMIVTEIKKKTPFPYASF